MARPSAVSAARANATLSSKHKNNKKSSRVVSDDSEQDSASGTTEEATSSDNGGDDGRKPAAKRRVFKQRQSDDDDEHDDADSDENEDASQPKSRSSKAAVNKAAGATRTAKSSSESQGSTASSAAASNGVGAASASASVMKPRHPLQPAGGSTNAAIPRSPFRTVSLNDSPSNTANQNSARRRLSGQRFSAADALRRQSLPSTLRKTAAIAGGDGDASFASSNGASPARPLARLGAGSATGNAGQLQPVRRTSAGFALQGGGIGALNAAGNALRRNASNTSNGNPAADLTNATLPMPIISAEVMTSNYEEWMKMATDNKINSSNTWNFALIDYFHDMSLLRNADDGGSINFQKASCTLDGCVKIWTSRVDSVATETGKLLNGLAGDAAARAAEAESGDEEEDGEGGEGGAEGRPKKKRTKTHTTTLADNFSKIQVKDLELEFTVDPLFKKTSADFDEGGAAGLLMNHLGSDSNMRVVFDAGDAKVLDPEDDNDQEEDGFNADEKLPTVDISKLRAKFLPNLDMLEGRSICPSFKHFKFNCDRNLLDLSLFNRSNLGASTSSAANQPAANVLDDLTLANQAEDLPAAGGPVQDFFDDGAGNDWDAGADVGYDGFGGGGDDADMSDREMDLVEGAGHGAGFVAQAGGNHLGAVQRFDPRMDPDERELVIGMGGDEGEQKVFAYFDTALTKNWAGPEHWKMRRTIRRAEKERQLEENEAAAAEGGKGKKREKKQPEWLDFSAAIDSKKLFASSKASITLPAKAKRGAAAAGSKDEHLLPDDKHFSSQQLLRLFLKPKAAVNMRRRLARAVPRPEGEVDEHYWAAAAAANGAGAQGPGNMDAADDDDDDDGPALPFDTQFFHDEADTPDFDEDLPMGGDEFEGPVGGVASTSANAGSNAREEEEDLLAATQGQMRRARPLYVNYAKKAKRVDVRMLKENIWKELAIEKQAQAADDDESLELEPTDFTAVISGLRKTYPPEKMEEISTSFCFICLLHLANEQGLRIRSEQIEGVPEAGSSTADVRDMETTARFVGGLDRLKILKEVLS